MVTNNKLINTLIKDANKAFIKGEIPVSALIIDEEGNIVSRAYNNRQCKYNLLGHAEILAILKAEKKIKDWRLDKYSMIVVLEPCDMCSMIISKSRLDKVYYLIPQKDKVKDDFGINKEQIKGYEQEKEKLTELLFNFFENMR